MGPRLMVMSFMDLFQICMNDTHHDTSKKYFQKCDFWIHLTQYSNYIVEDTATRDNDSKTAHELDDLVIDIHSDYYNVHPCI